MSKKERNKQRFTKNIENIAKTFRSQGKRQNIYSDVNGSYKGRGYDDEYPVQDADDL